MPSPDHLVVLLTPLLVVLMLAEWLVACLLGRRVHGGRQTLNNLAVAVGQRVVNSAVGLAPLAGYPLLQAHLGLLSWSPSEPVHWVLAFFAVDLAFYVRHRLAHRVAWLWALHAVHHQSTEYNFTVATRLSWVQEALLFAVPLAVLGLPLEMLLPLFALGNLWQFVQHTELVGSLGVLEQIFMTPSNHRVHHGCNPQYLDKNYGNILVIWDRLLGTWEREREPVIYGTLDGLSTYDALENNVRPVVRLLRKASRANSWVDALRCFVAPPEWDPELARARTGEPPAVPSPQRVRTPSRRGWILSVGLVVGGLACALAVTWLAAELSLARRMAGMAVVVGALAIAGTTLDGRRSPRPTLSLGWLAEALAVLAGASRGPVWWVSRTLARLA